MLRSSTSLCLFCRFSSPLKPNTQWQQLRNYAQAQRKRPSRMVLSSHVGRSGPARGAPKSRRGSEASSKPFAGSRDRDGPSRGGPSSRGGRRGSDFGSRGQGRFSDRKESRSGDKKGSRFSDRRDTGRRNYEDTDKRWDQDPIIDTNAAIKAANPGISRNDRRKLYFKDVMKEQERTFVNAERTGILPRPGKTGRAVKSAKASETFEDEKFDERPSRDGDREARPRRDSETKSGTSSRAGENWPLWAPSRSERKKVNDGGLTKSRADRPAPGPFGALNQRVARGVPEKTVLTRDRNSNKKDKDARKPGDFHSLKMQQALATVGYGSRNQTKSKIEGYSEFEDFPLLPSVRQAIKEDALKGMEAVVPTPIQRLAIPSLLGMEESRRRKKAKASQEGDDVTSKNHMQQFLLAAETGSGKTMAYMIPAVDTIKRAEEQEKRIEEGRKAQKEAEEQEKKKENLFALDPPNDDDLNIAQVGTPKVIVLVPTAELVEQVGALAKSLSHKVKIRAAFVSSNYSHQVIKNRLYSPIDVLVSTPHLLASIAESDPAILSKVSHLVIDEADSLLDRSFAPTTTAVLDRVNSTLDQLVLCSATIPRRLDNYLRDRFPDIKRLTTPNLHAIPRRVQLGVVDVEKDPYKGNKDLACADVIWKIGASAIEHGEGESAEKVQTKRLLVFVNEREKSVELAQYLASKGVDAVALNRDLDTRSQTELLAQFCGAASPTSDPEKASWDPQNTSSSRRDSRQAKRPARILPNTKVLVATDIASRGIDTTAVRHVILYDVPHTSIDFIHRLGRTGRMGRRGRGVVLVGKGDRKDVVREIREAMFRGSALI